MGEVVEFPAPLRVTCPDRRGRGRKWCRQSGQWLDVTAESSASVTRVPEAAGDRARSAEHCAAAAALEHRAPGR